MASHRHWTWLVVLAIVSTGGATAIARPPYPVIFQEYYVKNEPVLLAAKEAKCNVCHSLVPENLPLGGKPRNEYGLALGRHFGAKDFKMLNKPEQKDELAAALKAALKAVEKEKNLAGTPFGEIIKSGKLPVPVEEAKEGKE
jgi:hypothetical protein